MQIIVLGMHRSGTSALTGLLSRMGAHVGAPDELLPSDNDNPRGFFERLDALAINREILRLAGCHWHQTAQWHPPLIPSALGKAMQRLINHLSHHPVWALKDPRLCLTLSCWKPFLNKPLVVIMYRDPLAIASSLLQRNRMPPDYALALWEQHAVSALHAAAPFARLHVDHAELMAMPQRIAAVLAEAAGLHASAQAIEFIEPSLVRARSDSSLSLSAHQQHLCAILRGDAPYDPLLAVSEGSMQRLYTMGRNISGAPAGS